MKIKKYEFDPKDVLGKGAFGIVYKGKHNFDGKSQEVAIKSIPKDIIDDPSKMQLLNNEILISIEINREDKNDNENIENRKNKEVQENKEENKPKNKLPNFKEHIVNFIDITSIDDKNYLVYEYCNGGNLEAYLDYFKGFDERMVQYIMSQVIKGLNVLHNKKIVHHDIKPENILIELCPEIDEKEKDKEKKKKKL